MADFLMTTSAMPVYMIYPRFLMDMDLSETEKLVYVILLDRAQLSMSNGNWEDESGHVFLIYPIKSLAETLHKSEMTVKRALAVLEERGLIHRKRMGLNQANRIFVRLPSQNASAFGEIKNALSGGNADDPPEGTDLLPLTERKCSVKKAQKCSTNKNDGTRTTEQAPGSETEQMAYFIHNDDLYLRLKRIKRYKDDGEEEGDYTKPDYFYAYSINDINGYSVDPEANNELKFMFVQRSEKTYPQYEHTGTKVGVTQIVNPEINTDNKMKVLIYKTIYDETKGEYVTYGIDGDGRLVPAYDHGDQIMLYGKDDGSAWWTVQIGDNGYVNFRNASGKYLYPKADGTVELSDTAPGVQLRSKIDRQDKDFVAHNAAIIKWDGDSYYGLEVNDGTLGSGIVTPTEYQEFSFAKVYVEGEKYDGWKHKVETVSDPNITVTMYNFPDEGDSHKHSTHAIAGTIGYVDYTQAIITALNGCGDKQSERTAVEADPEKAREEAFLQRIEETIRHAIEESPIGSMVSLMRLFQAIPVASVPATAVTLPEPALEEQPEEDWSAADDFMSGF